MKLGILRFGWFWGSFLGFSWGFFGFKVCRALIVLWFCVSPIACKGFDTPDEGSSKLENPSAFHYELLLLDPRNEKTKFFLNQTLPISWEASLPDCCIRKSEVLNGRL